MHFSNDLSKAFFKFILLIIIAIDASVTYVSVYDIMLSFGVLKALIPLHYKITSEKMKMKKVVFAIQVFGLIAVFPAYIVAELNRGNGRLTINNSSSHIIRESTKKNIKSKVNSAEENGDVILFKSKWTHY